MVSCEVCHDPPLLATSPKWVTVEMDSLERSQVLPRNEDTYTKIHFSRYVTWPGNQPFCRPEGRAFPQFGSRRGSG